MKKLIVILFFLSGLYEVSAFTVYSTLNCCAGAWTVGGSVCSCSGVNGAAIVTGGDGLYTIQNNGHSFDVYLTGAIYDFDLHCGASSPTYGVPQVYAVASCYTNTASSPQVMVVTDSGSGSPVQKYLLPGEVFCYSRTNSSPFTVTASLVNFAQLGSDGTWAPFSTNFNTITAPNITGGGVPGSGVGNLPSPSGAGTGNFVGTNAQQNAQAIYQGIGAMAVQLHNDLTNLSLTVTSDVDNVSIRQIKTNTAATSAGIQGLGQFLSDTNGHPSGDLGYGTNFGGYRGTVTNLATFPSSVGSSAPVFKIPLSDFNAALATAGFDDYGLSDVTLALDDSRIHPYVVTFRSFILLLVTLSFVILSYQVLRSSAP